MTLLLADDLKQLIADLKLRGRDEQLDLLVLTARETGGMIHTPNPGDPLCADLYVIKIYDIEADGNYWKPTLDAWIETAEAKLEEMAELSSKIQAAARLILSPNPKASEDARAACMLIGRFPHLVDADTVMQAEGILNALNRAEAA